LPAQISDRRRRIGNAKKFVNATGDQTLQIAVGQMNNFGLLRHRRVHDNPAQ
jgi:hypothetical protein